MSSTQFKNTARSTNSSAVFKLGPEYTDVYFDITPFEFDSLIALLNSNSELISIEINNSTLTDDDVRALADALKINVSLTRLSLTFTDITYDGMRELANALQVNSTISYVNMKGNDHTDAFVDILNFNTTIRCIDLTIHSHSSITLLTNAIKINSSIENVKFWYTPLADKSGVDQFIRALTINSTITHLSMICSNDITEFFNMLQINSSLANIDIALYDIIEKNIQSVTDAMKKNVALTCIALYDIIEKNIQSVTDAMKKNVALTCLDIYKIDSNQFPCKISDEVKKALEQNDSIATIRFYSSSVGKSDKMCMYGLAHVQYVPFWNGVIY